MKIRNYESEDENNVKKLIEDTMRSTLSLYEIEWEDFSRYIKFLVAVEDGEVIGCAAIKKIDDEWAKLKRMYIKQNLQRKGFGKALLNECIKFCRKNGFKKIVLTTYKEMNNAVSFYSKNGFMIVENHSDKYFTDPSRKEYNKSQVVMEKLL